MEGGGGGSDLEREEEDDSVSEVLRDRFRLSTISVAEAQGSFPFSIPHCLVAEETRQLNRFCVVTIQCVFYIFVERSVFDIFIMFSQEKRHGNI